MNKPEQVSCDECDKVFTLKESVRKHPGGIEEVYIKCPHCSAEVIAYVTDFAARKKQEQILKLNEKLLKEKAQLSKQLARLKAKIMEAKEDEIHS